MRNIGELMMLLLLLALAVQGAPPPQDVSGIRAGSVDWIAPFDTDSLGADAVLQIEIAPHILEALHQAGVERIKLTQANRKEPS